MDDLISRQAAIDALDEQIKFCDNALCDSNISLKDEYAVKVERASLCAYKEILEYLPSAQPQSTMDQVNDTAQSTNDLISRQAAIDAINKAFKHVFEWDGTEPLGRRVLKDVPTAQPDLSSYSDKLWRAAYERGKAEAQPQWIPCAERLPEKFGYCIVSDGCSVWFASFESGEFRGILSGHALDLVIAWQPLPEPWEEQDEP